MTTQKHNKADAVQHSTKLLKNKLTPPPDTLKPEEDKPHPKEGPPSNRQTPRNSKKGRQQTQKLQSNHAHTTHGSDTLTHTHPENQQIATSNRNQNHFKNRLRSVA